MKQWFYKSDFHTWTDACPFMNILTEKKIQFMVAGSGIFYYHTEPIKP